jgi:hypothetical protein
MAGVLVGASLIGGVASAGDIQTTSEDEDAYVYMQPGPGRTTGFGTGFLNQVQYMSARGRVFKNVADGSLTVYGLPPNTTHILYVAAGRTCPGTRGPAFGSTMRITTDALGGWHGPVHFSFGRNATWVVKTFNYRLVVSSTSSISSAVATCGIISDDPDIE